MPDPNNPSDSCPLLFKSTAGIERAGGSSTESSNSPARCGSFAELVLRPPCFRGGKYSLAFFAFFDRFNLRRYLLTSRISVGHPEVCPGLACESLNVLFSDDLRRIG